MADKKAGRNRTIDISVEEGKHYLKKCLTVKKAVADITEITDSVILGDTFRVLELLPEKSVDLIIADPPYNLTKSYNGSTFSKKKAESSDSAFFLTLIIYKSISIIRNHFPTAIISVVRSLQC